MVKKKLVTLETFTFKEVEVKKGKSYEVSYTGINFTKGKLKSNKPEVRVNYFLDCYGNPVLKPIVKTNHNKSTKFRLIKRKAR